MEGDTKTKLSLEWNFRVTFTLIGRFENGYGFERWGFWKKQNGLIRVSEPTSLIFQFSFPNMASMPVSYQDFRGLEMEAESN